MNIKGVIITCLVVVLYLSLCSWRVERLDDAGKEHYDTLIVNVK
jgi:hypothetical protein